jgi:hypothetical protein
VDWKRKMRCLYKLHRSKEEIFLQFCCQAMEIKQINKNYLLYKRSDISSEKVKNHSIDIYSEGNEIF